MKKLIKSLIFIVIFLLLFFTLIKFLWLKDNSIAQFYYEPENSLDVVYIGSSSAYIHFNTVLAYHEYGFTTGMLSSDAQSFAAVKFLIKESEKYQKPKLYVIDITKLADDFDTYKEGDIRKVTDSMKFSQNRIDTIDKLLSYTDVDKEDYINYYFSFLMYHNNWKTQFAPNLFGVKFLYKGYLFYNTTIEKEPQNKYIWSNELVEMNHENKLVLMDLLKFIEDNKLNVIFVLPKREYDFERNSKLNHAISIIEENNYNFINFNNLDDFEVDYKSDYYNFAHMNVWGATKYTLYFSEYLRSNYDLPNHKGDKKYESWEKEYNRFKEDFSNLTHENFDMLLEKYKNKVSAYD